MEFVILTRLKIYESLAEDLENSGIGTFHIFSSMTDLEDSLNKGMKPAKIFVPHWSEFIPAIVYDNHETIIFHMTDLPFGRGGSPLQNLIERGFFETKISAIRCVKGLDSGDIYCKESLSLAGTAEEIILRARDIIEKMIGHIVKFNPKPTPQKGEVYEFKRRKPFQSNVSELETLNKLYDFIRMLDGPGYPKAFVELKHFVVEFDSPHFREDGIHCNAVIRRRDNL